MFTCVFCVNKNRLRKQPQRARRPTNGITYFQTTTKMAGYPNNTTSASVLNAACTDTEVTLSDLLLVPPFRMMVTGPSSAGKSTFVLNFVKYRRQVCAEQFGRILYCRPDSDQTEHSKRYVEAMREEFDNLEVVAGLPDLSMCRSGDHCLVSTERNSACQLLKHHLAPQVILDDLANDIFGSKDMLDLFTRDSHHGKISVIITSQRFFTKKKHGKDIQAQMTYHVIFR